MPQPPLLDDDELAALWRLAAPLDRDLQEPFLNACLSELERYDTLGPGLVSRVGRQLQREFFTPPAWTNESKYD